MSYRYLTRSYVEWLGLERVPLMPRRTGASCVIGGSDTLPRAPSVWPEGVAHDGGVYEREPDGLAYERRAA